jgi:hypothetical protein
MLLIAPDFPGEIEECCKRFKDITGFQLYFLPVPILLQLVNRYRKMPILNHDWIESFFQKERIISEMSELVIPERKGIVDYINIEHDYYEIWERILKKLGREFVNILKETSFSQVKNTELKEDLLKMLKVK